LGLLGEAAQIEWLARKGGAHGFELLSRREGGQMVDSVRITAEGLVRGRCDGRTITFLSVLFDGLLRVTDADRFATAVEQGIGSGKGFGFGLLSIAPPEAGG
jgi:CRISPR system Cascade subunit CasE